MTWDFSFGPEPSPWLPDSELEDAASRTDPYFVGRVRRPAPRRLPPRLELDVPISKALDSFQALASAGFRSRSRGTGSPL